MASGHNTNLTSPVDIIAVPPPRGRPFCGHFVRSLPGLSSRLLLRASRRLRSPGTPGCPVIGPPSGLRCPGRGQSFLCAANIVLTEESVNGVAPDSDVAELNVCCSEVKPSLVGSTWDALQEHIVSSMLKIQDVSGNHLADQLRFMSTKMIAAAGLKTLRSLLIGQQPASAIDTLCFVHLIYAFSSFPTSRARRSNPRTCSYNRSARRGTSQPDTRSCRPAGSQHLATGGYHSGRYKRIPQALRTDRSSRSSLQEGKGPEME